MFSRILGAGCLAACLSVLACFLSLQSAQAQSSFPMDRFIDSNLSKVREKDFDRAADREYVCTSIGGFRFDGGYIMYIQPNVRVHTGERVDFLHGFYVQYDRRGNLLYVEGYSGAIVHVVGNGYGTAGYRYIPRTNPPQWRKGQRVRTRSVPIDRKMLFYKGEGGFPRELVVTMEFLDRGTTVLGCEATGEKPKWVEFFKDEVRNAIRRYNNERLDFT